MLVVGTLLSVTACQDPPAARPRNVILLSIDDLRADRLGCYGHTGNTSPTIDRLAREGARIETAYATAPWTLPSHMSMFTSRYPSQHGVNPPSTFHRSKRNFPVLAEDIPTLPERLREHGFATAAFTDGAYVWGAFGFSRGFDVYFQNRDHGSIPPLEERMLQWLGKNSERPFFMFLHTFAVHMPFAPPEEHLKSVAPGVGPDQRRAFSILDAREIALGHREVTPELLEEVRTLYDAGIHQVDAFVGRLVDELARLGRREDTLLVVTSDHGEEFYEHGSLGHGPTLFDEVLRVPLVFLGPGVQAGVVVQEPASLVDLAPTILDLVGAGPHGDEQGQSLGPYLRGEKPSLFDWFGRSPRRLLYAETAADDPLLAIIDGSRKAIHRASDDSMQVFDTTEDPAESRDLAGTHPQLEKRYRDLAAEYRARTTGSAGDEIPISDGTREKLRALGYVAD